MKLTLSTEPMPSSHRRMQVIERRVPFGHILGLGYIATLKRTRYWAVMVCSNRRPDASFLTDASDWRGARCG